MRARLQLSWSCRILNAPLRTFESVGRRHGSRTRREKVAEILFRFTFEIAIIRTITNAAHVRERVRSSRRRGNNVDGFGSFRRPRSHRSWEALQGLRAFVKAHDTDEVGRFNFLNIHGILRVSGRSHAARSNAL